MLGEWEGRPAGAAKGACWPAVSPGGKAKQTGDEKAVMPSPFSDECPAHHATTVCVWEGGEKK